MTLRFANLNLDPKSYVYHISAASMTYTLPSMTTTTHHPQQPEQEQQKQQATSPPAPIPTSTPALEKTSDVMQALEIARETPDGRIDANIARILEKAMTEIWAKVERQPKSYTMSPDEFSVFNYFQHRYVGNQVATAARSRYWENTTGPC